MKRLMTSMALCLAAAGCAGPDAASTIGESHAAVRGGDGSAQGDGNRGGGGASPIAGQTRVLLDPAAYPVVPAAVADRHYAVAFTLADGATVNDLPRGIWSGDVAPPLVDACHDDRFFVTLAAEHLPSLPVGFDRDAFAADLDRTLRDAFDAGWFETSIGPQGRLTAHGPALCHVVDTLRAAAVVALRMHDPAADPAAVHVGRQCGFAAQASGNVDWYLDVLAPDGIDDPGPGDVQVALLDTAIHDELIDLSHDAGIDFVADPPDTEFTHGDHMARLIRDVAGSAVTLHGVRVLDADGRGTPEDLARGLATALAVGGDDPLVVNLSLGWPAEMSQPRELSTANTNVPGGACNTHEDPVGASVLDMLSVAAAMDADPNGRRVSVLAATGNRGGEPARDDLLRAQAYGVLPPTSGCAAATTGWFFPAEVAISAVCAYGPAGELVDRAHPVIAVGAVGLGDTVAGWANNGREPAIVAPGQLAPLVQFAQIVGDDNAVITIETVTGSSVSTALATGVAARIQHRGTQNGGALDRVTLERTLHTTGHGVLRQSRSLDTTRVRRISACRAEVAFTPSAACPGGTLAACLAQTAPGDQHQIWVEDCFACFQDVAVACDASGVEGPTHWMTLTDVVDASAADAVPFLGGPADDAPFQIDENGAQLLDWFAMGVLGPQPPEPGCPDCPGRVRPDAAQVDLQIKLNHKLTGVQFTGAWLAVSVDGELKQTVDLFDFAPASGWTAGAEFQLDKVDTGLAPAEQSWWKDHVSLSLVSHQTDGKDVWYDDSPMPMEFYP